MDAGYSNHVNDAYALEIAPGAFAESVRSSGLGRERIGF